MAKQHKDWTEELGKTRLWTDNESKFEIFGSHRRALECFLPKCLETTVKRGGDNVMVWGCFAGNQVSGLVIINATVDQKLYHNILVHHAITSRILLVGHNFVFQQDNDPKHTSKMCTNYQHLGSPGVSKEMLESN